MTSDPHVPATYDQVAGAYAAEFPGTEPEALIDLAVLDQMVSMLPASPRVLDAGCGTGRIAHYLARRGCAVRGIDVSPGMLAMSRRDHPEIPVAVGSITQLPILGASVEAVVFWYSIIHLPDRLLPRVFAEAARVLGPGGLVALGFQSGDEVREIGAGFRRLGHDVHLDRYHRELSVVLAVAAAHGLFPLVQVVREPLPGERDPQAFAILSRQA
ncbi:class I SAM-dependent DNA methyltransferase [Cumulibacter manganitolerans]|uniref:class I SAM-dependent DNA methyltransferase n=1 Tax=Cumulibacter manganitolerans TaxID=1884992 RepID=UPI00129638CC|nr:class I SAM-dependent methyltransferase [Cumulibacter manganitolerans]